MERKTNRLKNYDYSNSGYYFITICTEQKKNILCHIVTENYVHPKTVLSETGLIVKNNIDELSNVYPTVSVEQYVIMPNHLHLILKIDDDSEQTQFAPTISRVIKQFKGSITKQIGVSIWQKSFYDHIIRDEKDYLRIAEYIENNPAKWQEDKYYCSGELCSP